MNSRNRWDDEDRDSSDEEAVIPDNWDDSSEESEEMIKVVDAAKDQKLKEENSKICSIDRPIHWKRFTKEFRKIRKLPVIIQDPRTVRVYIEPKVKKETKASKNKSKKKDKDADIRPAVVDKRFDVWQTDMAKALIRGDHVILDVATSCGKTWAVRNMVAEIVLRDNSTAIFVTPNYEILQENIKAILMDNRKTYLHSGNNVGGLQTKKLSNKRDDQPLSCQILCMTADNVSDFMTAAVNREFVDNLKFVILDEVHTEEVNNALWRLSLMPPEIQFVLLSATIGNTGWLQTELRTFRPNKGIAVIQHHVRPISLQRALFPKTMTLSLEGARVFGGNLYCVDRMVNFIDRSKETKEVKEARLIFEKNNFPIFCPNLIDPTARDTEKLMDLIPTGADVLKDTSVNASKEASKEYKGKNLPKEISNRETEYNLGQKTIKELNRNSESLDRFHTLIDQNIEDSTTLDPGFTSDHGFTLSSDDLENNPRKILSAFQTLHSMGMGPGLFFNNDPTKVVDIAKKLLATIQNLEHEDKDVRKQMKDIEKAEKSAKRIRDVEVNIRGESEISKLQMRMGERSKDKRGSSNSSPGRNESLANTKIVEIPCAPDKWRFTRFNEKVPYRTPGWIAELLHYGIGIYTSLMSRWLKDAMFEWFDKRKLAFILCDRSLSLGINLPVRSVILTGVVDRTLYEQMGGRAGRRGYDTEGYVFLATKKVTMKRLLHDNVQIREIKPMLGLSVLDMLRWHKESKESNINLDKEAIDGYIERYHQILGIEMASADSQVEIRKKEEKRQDDAFEENDFDSFKVSDKPEQNKQKELDDFDSFDFSAPTNPNSSVSASVDASVDAPVDFSGHATMKTVNKTGRQEIQESYHKRLQWLKETGWLRSKYSNLALNLEDLSTMILLHLIRKGKIDMMFVDALDPTKDFMVSVRAFMTLLCYLWEPRVITYDNTGEMVSDKNTETFLDPLDPKLQLELKQLSEIFGLDIPCDQKCSDYIMRFLRLKEFNSENRDSIGIFQRKLNNLISGMMRMTSGSFSETEPILTLLTVLSKELKLADMEEDARESRGPKYINMGLDDVVDMSTVSTQQDKKDE